MKRITLKKLSSSTPMEVFLYVKQHLLTQNQTSKREGNMCAYRSPDKLMCAAGCLMTTREYRKSFEGRYWLTLVEEGLVPSAHKDLIKTLQIIHDMREPSEWKRHLDRIEEDIKEGLYDE